MKNNWVQFVKLGAIYFWVRFGFVSGLAAKRDRSESKNSLIIFFLSFCKTSACDDLDFVAKLELDEVLPTEFLERLRLLLPDGPAKR